MPTIRSKLHQRACTVNHSRRPNCRRSILMRSNPWKWNSRRRGRKDSRPTRAVTSGDLRSCPCLIIKTRVSSICRMSGWSVRKTNHAMPRVTELSKFKRTSSWMQVTHLQTSNKRTTCLTWAWIWTVSSPRSCSQATSWKISQPKIWLLKTSAVICSITSIKKWIKLAPEGKAQTIITKIWTVLITTNLATSSTSNSQ